MHSKKSIPSTYFFFVRKYVAAPLPYMHLDILHNMEFKFRRKVLRDLTLPSKIVSLLRNSQNEGVFHNPQRSRVTRKHKCIQFMSILPPPGPSHPRGAAEAAAVPPSNTSLQCQAQLSWPFFLAGYHSVN